ncbi:MAG: transposase, partial [Selenomonas sp.]|nr:transposase [Selenomonas sp.]
FNRQKNDIAYQVADRFIVLNEHQSTINENMPIRMLMYAAMIYRRLIPRHELYRERRFALPFPEFYEFNTSEKLPPVSTMRLSEAFSTGIPFEPPLELIVTRYNISYNVLKENKALWDFLPLRGYSFFVHTVEDRKNTGESPADAIRNATDYCIEHDILRKFLLDHYEEVFDMYSLRWNEEDYKRAMQEDAYDEGMEKGLEKGKLDTTIFVVKNMLNMKRPYAEIAQATSMPPEEIARIAEEAHLSY